MLVPRTPGVRTYADHLAGRWFLHTNRNARDFMLATADSPQAAADPARWRPLLPHRPGVSIEGFALFRSAVAVMLRSQANLTIALIDIPAADASTPPAEPRVIPAPGNLQAFSMSLGENRDSDFDRVRVVFTSMITPATTLDVHLRTGDAIVRKVQPVIGYDASLYRTARAWATTADGKRVPISLAWRNGLVQQNASAPVLIDGYGAYGIASDAEFRSEYVSLLDRGFLLAIAHVRGGSDLGQDWYEDGRLQHKRNSFADFVAVADALADQRWCDPARRFAVGGSAGGLLMGAVANIGGDRFAGIVMDVPFVDVVTTMLDETIPLTTNEWTQWGNPLTDAAAYRTMLAYSPYDNLQPKPYPAILVTTGLWDSQVQYFEPAKYVARLRRLKTDANPLLFNINFDAGHGGNSGRFRSLEEDALRQAFILDLAGLRP
ncbi:MAG: S9 family peptidase [Phycisphaerales bacterium]|nr:S9 family peptidase [Phycisphaerales bacterium]